VIEHRSKNGTLIARYSDRAEAAVLKAFQHEPKVEIPTNVPGVRKWCIERDMAWPAHSGGITIFFYATDTFTHTLF